MKNPGTYKVTVTNTCGTITDSVSFRNDPIQPPNIFTPNGDGKNEIFSIVGLENTEREFSVFNRLGARVFHESPFKNSWTGAGLPDGVYYYILGKEGCEWAKGTVTILR